MPQIAALLFSGELIDTHPVPLSSLFSGYAAVFAKALFLSFKEGDAASGTVLRGNSPELCTGVTVRAVGNAALHVVPVEAHMALPVRVIAQLIHVEFENAGKGGELGFGLGSVIA